MPDYSIKVGDYVVLNRDTNNNRKDGRFNPINPPPPLHKPLLVALALECSVIRVKLTGDITTVVNRWDCTIVTKNHIIKNKLSKLLRGK